MHREVTDYININPLQRGGILTSGARKTLEEWADGYSVCDFCDGCLDRIKKPPIENFVHEQLPKFMGTEIARITNGAREGKFLVMHALREGGTLILDGNAHYTSFVAAERARMKIKLVENSGYPEFKIKADDYKKAIEEVKKETGKFPKLAILTYPDGNYGNFPDAKKVSEICKNYKIPFLLNAAYTLGRKEINAIDLGADFIVGSGHKSMASTGPIGVIGTKKEYEELLFKKSEIYKNKEIELLGCSARGLSIITLMTSFPEVARRVKNYEEEIKKARFFAEEVEKAGLILLGQKPHLHDLMFFESKKLFQISQKRDRYFLYKELKNRGIMGIKPGLTLNFKLSTYGLADEELNEVIKSFQEIAELD